MFDGINQQMNEERYNRKHIDGYIRTAIQENPDTQAKIQMGVELLDQYINGQYYASKMKRVAQLQGMNLETLVTDIFVGIAYHLKEELFTSVTAQMAGRLRFNDKAEAITTVAEIVAVLCRTDAFDILKASKSSSLVVVSRLRLTDQLVDFIQQSQYLPPMVCPPLELQGNFDSGYLTHKDSLILGNGNHHDGDICLDTLNIMNSVALSLDLEYLSKVEETPTFALDTQDKVDMWKGFKKQSYRFYSLIAQQGNVFWLTHKVDKRGRAYAQGYHISTQGTAFKKASIELAKQEYVTGVPI
jgi:hypothetical protein